MRATPVPRLTSLAALACLVVFLGCSRQPTEPAPPASTSYSNPSFVRVSPTPPSALTSGPGSGSLDITEVVDGATGGCVTAGRFSVTIPAGAFDGLGEIRIVVPDTSVMRCELRLSPDDHSGFRVPVLLQANCSGIAGLEPAALRTLWFNPADGLWYEEPTSVDVASFTVATPLWHFSDYGVADTTIGKSGW
jgi:hypothetical protein